MSLQDSHADLAVTVDPVALYAAVLASATALYGLLANRTRLRCFVSIEWPDAKPRPESDLGVDPGDAYIRIDITNEGRRPTTVIRGGFVTTFGPASGDRFRALLTRISGRLAPVGRKAIGHLPLTPAGIRQDRRLDEHETWSSMQRAREVAYELGASGRGRQRIVGAYAELISGRVVYWTPTGAHGRGAVDALERWQGGYYDAFPAERPSDEERASVDVA